MIDPWRHAPNPEFPAASGPPPVLLLLSVPESAAAARRFVREHVEHYQPTASDDFRGSVELVACELVTNAIRYGTEPGDSVRLVVDVDDTRTRLEVHDPVRRRPKPRPESDRRDRGRGLLIVDTLCPGAWGAEDRPFGKAVWAEVKL
ncbi:ATP-binding protein [Streptomyces albidoflavus]